MNNIFIDVDETLECIAVSNREEELKYFEGSLKDVLQNIAPSEKDNIVLGLSRNLFVSRKVSLPDISLENVKEALSYKVKKIFSFLTEPLFFYLPTHQKNEYIVIATERKKIEEIIEKIKGLTQAKIAGITLTGLFISELVEENATIIIKRKSCSEYIKKIHGKISDYHILKSPPKKQIESETSYICKLYPPENSECIKLIGSNLNKLYEFMRKHREGFNICFNIAPDLTERLEEKDAVPRWLVVLTIVSFVFFIISPYFYFFNSINTLTLTRENMRKKAANIKKLIKKEEEIEKEIKTIQKLTKPYVLDVLAEVGRVVGNRMEILNIYLSPQKIKITGYSDKSAEIVTLLEKSPLLTNVKLSGAIIRAREGKERFTIEAHIVR